MKAINKKSGVESTFTEKEWDAIQKNPFWDGKFVPVKDTTPKEVKEMEAKRTTTATKGTEVKSTTTSNAHQSINTIKK